MSVEREYVRGRGEKRAPRLSRVRTRERVPVGRVDVLASGEIWATPRPEVVARANGCPWDESTCTWAAKEGISTY